MLETRARLKPSGLLRPVRGARQDVPAPLTRFVPYVLLVAALVPSTIWIALDQQVWPFDQAWYGEVTVELFYGLLYAPSQWPAAMAHAFEIKAPGLAWLGQLFVPLAGPLGGMDHALLASILVTQAASLFMLYFALQTLVPGRRVVAFSAVLLVASFPLFVGLSHQYFVEPLQMLVVAWFVLLMVRGVTWHPLELLLHLAAAAGLGMLAKITSPLYCVGPGLVVLWHVVRWYVPRLAPGGPRPRLQAGRLATAALIALAFGAGALVWYGVNRHRVIEFAFFSYSSPTAELWGTSDTFPHKISYWLGALRDSFAFTPVAVGMLALVAFGLASRIRRMVSRASTANPRALDLYAAVAVFQVCLLIATFSAGINQEQRYILPLAPYVAMLAVWLLAQVSGAWLAAALVALAVGQAAATNAQSLALIPTSSDVSSWLYPTDRDPAAQLDLVALVDATCDASANGRTNIVGVEMPSFSAEAIAYVSAMRLASKGIGCDYSEPGSFADTDVTHAWNMMLGTKPLYFVTPRPEVLETADPSINQIALPLLQRVENSALFDLQAFPQDPDILVFKRHQT